MKHITQNYPIHIRKMFSLFVLLIAPHSLSADNSSCEAGDPCCEEIEYIDYTPWEAGDDAGLWCLPGSSCTYSNPTRPSGPEIYEDVSHLVHKSRYPSDHSPKDWRTIMLHMRTLLPMTAWDHRMALNFLQGKQDKPHLKKDSNQENANVETAEKGQLNNEKNSSTKEIAKLDPEEDSHKEKDSLDEIIGPISTVSQAILDAVPASVNGYLSKFNSVFYTIVEASYYQPGGSFFGDLEGNNTFVYSCAPIFMTSYGDSLFSFLKLVISNFGQSSQIGVTDAYVAYVYNDYITFEAGKFRVPFTSFGLFYTNPCINKTASYPLALGAGLGLYGIPIHAVDIGFEVKGAIPLCFWTDYFSHPSFTYEVWIGNGPSEVNPNSGSLFPNGSFYTPDFEGNIPNNNNEFAYGARLGFLPDDLQNYGISFLRGRYTTNKTALSGAFGLSGDKKVYQGVAFDWNINIHRSIVFRGFYAWTQHESNLVGFNWITNHGYWSQLAFGLDLMECIAPELYCWKPCLWDRLELVFGSDMAWNTRRGATVLGFDYSGYDMKRFLIDLNYYFTQSFVVKVEYDFNYGDTGHNFVREELTGSTKKTGFGTNVFIFQVAYGW